MKLALLLIKAISVCPSKNEFTSPMKFGYQIGFEILHISLKYAVSMYAWHY